MFILFGVVVIIVAILLALVVIIQNPKGGMLSSSIGSVGNQILGASRSTDAVEKITWYLAGGLMILCVASIFIIPDGKTMEKAEGEGSQIQKAIKENPTTNLPSTSTITAPQAPQGQPAAQPQGSAPTPASAPSSAPAAVTPPPVTK
jgi:preprotein translocase subunit SecG